MRIAAFLILLFIAQTGTSQVKYSDFPSINEILDFIRKDHLIEGQTEKVIRRIEKRPEGWFIGEYNYVKDMKHVNSYVLWSAEDDEFNTINKWKRSGYKQPHFPISLGARDKQLFEIHPFYGYNGWDDDVINLLEPLEFRSDTLNYGLGRAYSSKYTGSMHGNDGYSLNGEFNLEPGRNAMTKEQIKEVQFYYKKSISCFDRVNEQNPNFETWIGEINIKASNEKMVLFLDLLIKASDEEAFKLLSSDFYSPFMIEMAKNYLKSCDENAILFTNGDSDTYPLLYVQAHLGFRTDVRVVNLSLLQTSDYINYMTYDFLDSPELDLSYSREEILNGDIAQIYYVKPLTSVSEDLQDISTLTLEVDESPYPILTSDKFFIASTEMDTIKFEIESDRIIRNQLIAYDIIANNFEKRPIHFTSTVGIQSCYNLEWNLVKQGYVLKLTDSPDFASQIDGDFYLNLDRSVDLLLNELYYELDCSACRPHERLVQVSIFAYAELAQTLYVNGRKDEAALVLDKCLDTFSDHLSRSIIDIYILDLCFHFNRDKEADLLLRQLIENIVQKRAAFENNTRYERSNYVKYIEASEFVQKNWQEYEHLITNAREIIEEN